jgi:uncharacterized protein YgiM (DUF1202 family)
MKWLLTSALALALGLAPLAAPASVHAQDSGQNLLDNPSMSWPDQKNPDVCAQGWIKDNALTPRGWTAFWACKSGSEQNQDQVNREPEFRLMNADVSEQRPRVRSYPTSASFFTFFSLNRNAGIYQTVRNITPGQRLRFSAWTQLWTTNGDDATSVIQPGGLQARVCIDTIGATLFGNPNWNSPSMVCSTPTREYDRFVQISVEATAASNQVTVIFDSGADYPVKHNDVFVDDAELVVIGGPAVAAPAPAVAAAPAAAPAAALPASAGEQPKVTVTTPTANIRAGTSIQTAIIATVPQGTTLVATAISQDRQWWQVEYQGQLRFINAGVVSANQAAIAAASVSIGATPAPAAPAAVAAAPAAAPAAPAAAATLSPAQLPVVTRPTPAALPPTATPVAGAASAAPTPSGTEAGVTANTGTDRLLVRAAPGPNGRVLTRVPNGTRFKVIGVSPDKIFWRVEFPASPSGSAWVMVRWTTPNAAARALLS